MAIDVDQITVAKTSPHGIPVEAIISRVHAIFPGVSNNYIMMLINDSLVELGMYQTRYINAKLHIEEDKMWYHIGDSAKDGTANAPFLKLNKLSRVDIMDSDGDYIRIPRLLDKNVLLSDADSEEDAIEYPG